MTTTEAPIRPARRYACISGNGYPHTSGNGAPKRKRCAHCGSSFYTMEGTWGVFVWTGNGRYPLSAALDTFSREEKADEFARTNADYVVRWVMSN